MKVPRTKRRRSSQAGVAMLIAIFVLLMIAVVGIALIVSSGTETALAGNYRSSTAVRYAALAGLEEGRGRLLPKNPFYLNTFVAQQGSVLPVGQVRYITNPANGEDVLATYPDTEYDQEFNPGALAAATVNTIPSVSNVAGIQGPLYRWVRINAATEKSLNRDIDNDGSKDTGLVYYDGTHLTSNPTNSQALEITSLAALPNGTQKLVQYVVAPASAGGNPNIPTVSNFVFPAALTMVGSPGYNVQFAGPGDPSFFINGTDQFKFGACQPGPTSVPALAYANGGDASNISAAPASQYVGVGGNSTTPSVSAVSLPAALQTPAQLEAMVENIVPTADVVLGPDPPPAPSAAQTFTQADLHTGLMSPTNPLTIVVNGNLNVTNWDGVGYGLLVVRGTFNYDPSATWNGIVLVVGQGQYYSDQDGTGQINGAMLIARTLGPDGRVLSYFDSPSFIQKQSAPPPSGNGIYYGSCLIKQIQQMPTQYRVLSFREISQ